MAVKKTEASAYNELKSALDAKNPARCYVFHGQERYLLENALNTIRDIILPDGQRGFNYHRFTGAFELDELREAVETYPFLAERTLIEIWDMPLSAPKKGDANGAPESMTALTKLLASLPDFVCVVFVYDIVEWKPDRRVKAVQEFIKHTNVVEFMPPTVSELAKWTRRHFKARGREISQSDAEYLIAQTGSFMTPLLREIEKLASYRENGAVTRADIDLLVEKSLDAKLYNLTDAIAERRFPAAFSLLADMLDAREPGQVIISGLSRHARRLYLARLYLDENRALSDYMRAADLNGDWQARRFYDAARKMTAAQCRRAVLLCCDCAFALNSGGGDEELTLLVAKLAS